MAVSKKSRLTASILACLLGSWGVDLFYEGRPWQGVFQIISNIFLIIITVIRVIASFIPLIGWLINITIGLGCLAIQVWDVIRIIKTLCGKAVDGNGDVISDWRPGRKKAVEPVVQPN